MVVQDSLGESAPSQAKLFPRVLLVAPSPPPYGGMALQARQLERLLRQDGVTVLFSASNFPLPGWLHRFDLPVFRTVLRGVLIWRKLWKEASQVDVVHVLAASWLYFFLVVYPAIIVGRLRRKLVVLNYRGGEAGVFFDRFGWITAPAFHLADVITAPSQFLCDIIHDRFQLAVKIVPNIVNTSAFSFRRRESLKPKLLVTRHLEKIYDVESVLRAFREVQKEIPEASLWIAGTGSQKEYLQSLAGNWNLRGVRFLGHVNHQDLAGIYDQCDIYVNGSRVDNFPGALMEASAAGLAVVSTSAGGIGYVYDHEKTALLVKPGDWQGLAAGIRRVLQEPDLTREMTARGVELAGKCTWKYVREALFRVYSNPSRSAHDVRPCSG